jgi:lysophospholipase L1-like esterase
MLSYILSVILVSTIILFIVTRIAAGRLISHHHAQKVSFFGKYPVKPGDIVFLGDSITDGARWNELFPGLPVKNRGINADTTSDVLERLDEIVTGQPAAVFILIGTNDLPWYVHHSDEKILSTYEAILQRFKSATPETQVFVQSILPRHKRYSARIRSLNPRLAGLAERYGYTFIDLFPHFADNGSLRADFTNDHLHLLAPGYAAWVEVLEPYVARICSQPSTVSTSEIGHN